MRSETFRTVCTFDPGLDTTRVSLDSMIEFFKGRDIAKVEHAFSATEPPTIYTIREIPHQLWESFVACAPTEDERFKRAFMCGVKLVENLYQQDGTRLPTWCGRKTERFGSSQLDIMSDEDASMFSPAERLEIGSVAFAHSFLPRRIAASYRLPPSLVQTLQGRDFLHAEPSPTDAESSKEST